MNSPYPPGYHVRDFLAAALRDLGATVTYDDPRLLGQEGLTVNGVPIVWFLDNRVPYNRERQDPVCAELLRRGQTIVLHCQKPDMQRCGGGWLPIAATPRFNPPQEPVTPEWDVAFVGFLNDDHRRTIMAKVIERFQVVFGQNVFYEEAAAVYHSARVGVNVPALYGTEFAYDANMRVFEIAACRIPLVTNYLPALSELGFRSGVNCLTYDNEAELFQCVEMLLDDQALALDIAQNGYRLIQDKHTYYHRAVKVLEMVGKWQISPQPHS